ncbi:MAG: hypothetical protein JNL28_07285 [Planctomycetes bacterium]|nr:hypothetical protein [Planctomycetota bacterium]
MRINKFLLAGVTALGLASTAMAGGRNPGSLLLFPEFDNRQANLTLLTVTNTNADTVNGTINVEFVYIGKYAPNNITLDCLEFNRTHTLTPNDTLSVITSAHNPGQEQGYVYVFAKDKNTGIAKVFNHLIGNEMTIMGIEALDYSLNPVSYKAIGQGTNADLDGDQNRDLDGNEYETSPDEVYIPRFLGQGGQYRSELILLGLSGGAAFTTIVNFWIYNDNEEAFSAQYSFKCWDRVRLETINGAFTETFLDTTNNAPNEIVGASTRESGWFRVYGGTAFSTAEQIIDPAVYAVLVEKIASHGASDLPFESVARQANGSLLPRGIFGDGNPVPVNGDNR